MAPAKPFPILAVFTAVLALGRPRGKAKSTRTVVPKRWAAPLPAATGRRPRITPERLKSLHRAYQEAA